MLVLLLINKDGFSGVTADLGFLLVMLLGPDSVFRFGSAGPESSC